MARWPVDLVSGFGNFRGAMVQYVDILKHADPALPPGLRFRDALVASFWKQVHAEIGAGWFVDRYLLLFSAGVERYERCAAAWGVLTGEAQSRMILGRNAYGALLVLEGASNLATHRVRVLDPFQLTFAGPARASFLDLFAKELPRGRPAALFADRLYALWRTRTGRTLGDDEVLAPRVPEDGGGQWEIGNLAPEDIFTFYERTASEWGPWLDSAAAPAGRKKKREVWL